MRRLILLLVFSLVISFSATAQKRATKNTKKESITGCHSGKKFSAKKNYKRKKFSIADVFKRRKKGDFELIANEKKERLPEPINKAKGTQKEINYNKKPGNSVVKSKYSTTEAENK
jgi:predicted membrane-bound mannosyltransferase